MPGTNSLDGPCESDPSSTSDPRSDPIGASKISAGAQCGGTDPDVQVMSQSSVRDTGSAICTPDIGEGTSVAADISIKNEAEARELAQFASSLMAEHKAQLSLSNLNSAILLFRQVLDSRAPSHPLRKEALKDLGSALGVRYMYTNQRPDVMEFLQLRTEMDQAAGRDIDTASRQGDSPDIESKSKLATELLTNFHKSTSLDVLNCVIVYVQKALPHLLSEHATRTIAFTALVDGLYARQHYSDDTMASDLDGAISGLEEAIRYDTNSWNMVFQIYVLLVERFDLTGDIFNLQTAKAYLAKQYMQMITSAVRKPKSAEERFGQFTATGNMDDLNSAITAFREEMANVPQGSESYAFKVNGLACALWSRFIHGGRRKSDIDEAISLHTQNLELRPSSHPSLLHFTLNNMAIALSARFDIGGQQSDLDEAISLHRQALEPKPGASPNRPDSLYNLANTLLTRSKQGGHQCVRDSDESISLYRQALELYPATHSNRSGVLDNLAAALSTRVHQGLGDQSDLHEVVALHKQALELRPPTHPLRSDSLNNLAAALSARFQKGLGAQVDLHEVVSLHRQALELRPGAHPNRSNSLTNLATSLTIRFEQGLGAQSGLDEAISFFRQALELRLPTHPNYIGTLYHLANALTTRFNQRGQPSDLDEAVSLHRRALEMHPLTHSNRPNSLNSLANVLLTRFKERLDQSDLDDSISLHRQALEPRQLFNPNHSSLLDGLAASLWTRFVQKGQQCDIDEAISLDRQALELRPPSTQFHSLTNLAVALATLFEHTSQQRDLDEAISLHRQALELRISTHPDRSLSLINLANTLYTRFKQKHHQADLDEATSFFSEATQCLFQSPSLRLDVSKQWVRVAETHDHNSLIASYNAALEALPQVAALTLTVELRQKALVSTGSDGLARDASSCAIGLEDYSKAIEFSEAGRSIFWSQVLSLRSPFHRLRNFTPDGPKLADRLQEIGKELDRGAHRQLSSGSLDNLTRLAVDQESNRLNRLGEEWAEILYKVRKFPGLENFLRPPRLSSLQPAASRHPVCLLIATGDKSHCLIMTLTTIHHIPLPNLHARFLKILVENVRMGVSPFTRSRSELVDKTRHAITEMMGEQRGISYQNNSEESDGIFKFVLRVLWDELVRPIVNHLNLKKHSEKLPILQWCLTGHFTFLPIHAAGNYDDDKAIDCAPDYFISSYTPTIGILLAEPSSHPSKAFKMMTVIQSQDLPATIKELEKIRQHVPNDALIELGIPGSPAGVEDVASRLSDMSIVHFACHGHQCSPEPLDSYLKIGGERLRISRIMKENMSSASVLATLFACETAMGDENLPDEAMSLAASLLFCGFRRVVATMWVMKDQDGPTIADAFYRELFCGSNGEKTLLPDFTKSAYALHVAVKKLRSLPNVSFRRWVPFIHMGQC